MLYIIGLGLNENSLSQEALNKVKKCKKVYLETYTVSLLYPVEKLEKIIQKKIILLDRTVVESLNFVKVAKKQDVALLIYGSPLFATTHSAILEECRKLKIPFYILFNASVFDAIGQTGLQLYKFGKITSLPRWQKNYQPESFIDTVLENKKINAHSLILIDIGLDAKTALDQLETVLKNKNYSEEKIILCSCLGTKNQWIIYGSIAKVKSKKIKEPFCIIIPAQLHFMEEECLKNFEI